VRSVLQGLREPLAPRGHRERLGPRDRQGRPANEGSRASKGRRGPPDPRALLVSPIPLVRRAS
jgi:hypothetical protein